MKNFVIFFEHKKTTTVTLLHYKLTVRNRMKGKAILFKVFSLFVLADCQKGTIDLQIYTEFSGHYFSIGSQ